MSWSILLTLVLVLGIALFATWSRRAELRRMAAALREREDAAHVGADRARLQHPVIDLSRCLGCGTCVDACPEQGVLELVHGQATVINGARCVGTAVCERECPVGAITVTLTNLETRTDVPVLSDGLEAMGAPGLFLAGEVTAHALIKTAVEHGTAVGAEVARRCAGRPTPGDGHHDLLIVGAGPAGLACALEAMRHGLRTLVLEQEAELGGTVAKYPRRKLVVTLPVDMPLHGRLKSRTYEKEELMAIWQQIATEHEVPIRHGEVFTGLERQAEGGFVVQTRTGTHRARHVCIAIGRRGVPVRLGVPGEELPKVAYSLLDAHSYQGRRILVVGGGDSAIECALALAGQPGNEITLSYRRERLFRARARNLERLEACIADGRIEVLYNSEVLGIEPDAVELGIHEGGVVRTLRLDNDDVFVMAGGVPPFELLERSGVSFDPSLRPAPAPVAERGTGLLRGLAAGFALALAALGWAFLHSDYYARPLAERATHAKHQWLRPSEGLGLLLGIAAIALIVVNLLYLVRRSPTLRFTLGSLQAWMSSHIATGILALLCALLHGAMSPRDTPGGHALWAMVVLLVTGAIGRYFYAYVPRAANGRELALAEVRARLGQVSAEWDRDQQRFSQKVRERLDAHLEASRWRGTFVGRVLALVGVNFGLRRLLRDLAAAGRADGIPDAQIATTLQLAGEAHRVALMAAHYEDLRAILATWRYVHRWVALLMVLLVIVHVVHALAYGSFFQEGGQG